MTNATAIYTIREWTSGKLVSHQFDRDDADLDARVYACTSMRSTFVTGPDGAIVSAFDVSGNRYPLYAGIDYSAIEASR